MIVLPFVLNALNAVSHHWSNYGGVKKWALFLIECLSFSQSKPYPPSKNIDDGKPQSDMFSSVDAKDPIEKVSTVK